MGDTRVEVGLDQLLSEMPESAALRARACRDLDGAPLVLYGAGNLGRMVLARLRSLGLEPVAFADDTPSKQGSVIEGLPVLPPAEASARFGPRAVFAVTILNPFASYLQTERRLRQLFDARVVPFLHLAWAYPEEFLPHYQFELPQQVLAKSEAIRHALNVFADEESRRQFVAHVRFRLRLDFAALPATAAGDYFPEDVLAPLPSDVTFVDCGAYDGDTVRRFISQQGDAFGRVYAFEPDASNCRRLREYVEGLGEEVSRRVRVYQAGVGARRERLRFNSTGDTSATFGGEGNEEVEILPLDEAVENDGAPLYIKFDVEGAEREALAGADRLIRSARPVVAISVYHRPDDLWELPAYLDALDLGYKLFLRTQGEDGMDVICYAVPPGSVAAGAGGGRHG